MIFENVNFRLPPGGIVGIIGPNGAGKTTLLRMMMGQEEPDVGELKYRPDRGARLRRPEPRRARSRQHRLRGNLRRLRQPRHGRPQAATRGPTCTRFNFTGTDQQKKVGILSGGERNRVHLAKLLRRGSNVLLLDEPTNDLDVDTLRALEEAVANFVGCAVVVSHDRWFLDRLATHILAFEGDGYVHWCEGNFQTYEEQRKQRWAKAPTNRNASAIRSYNTVSNFVPTFSGGACSALYFEFYRSTISTMSVVRVGTTKKFADNWDNIFGGKKKTTGRQATSKPPRSRRRKSRRSSPARSAPPRKRPA